MVCVRGQQHCSLQPISGSVVGWEGNQASFHAAPSWGGHNAMLHSCLPPCHCASSLDCLLDTYKIQTYSKIIVQVQNKKAYLYGVFYSATAMVDLNIMLWDTCTIMPFHASSVRLLSSSSPSWYFHLGICLISVPGPLLIDDRWTCAITGSDRLPYIHSLIPRPSPKCGRGSGVLSDIACHMGWGHML